MNTKKKLLITAAAISAVFVCGAWSNPDTVADTERYTNGSLISTCATETISYTSKQVVENLKTAFDVPLYYNEDNSLSNFCGAVAGTIAVGYYDRYYTNMISGWESYYNGYLYKKQDAQYVPATIKTLYALMKTNVAAAGVSVDEFKSGLSEYVQNQGYTVGYSSLGKGTGFNYTAFKTAIQNNKIAALFVSPSNLYTITAQNDKDVLTTKNISSNHIMIAYGYYEVKYTIGSSTRTDRYLQVATGYDLVPKAYYKIGSQLDIAYTIEVA